MAVDDTGTDLKPWQWREMTPRERFNRRYHIDENGCWIFNGALSKDGYASMFWNDRRYLAHRISYLWHVGDIPEGCEIDHLCRNKACVNPEHLEAVPHRENVLRGDAAIRFVVCRRGHVITGYDLRTDKRYCKVCRKERVHAKRTGRN